MKKQTNNLPKFSFSSILVASAVLLLIFFVAIQQNSFKNKLEQEQLLKEQALKKEQEKKELIKNMSVSEKKESFLKIVLLPLEEVYKEELIYFNDIKALIKENPTSTLLESIKKEYRAKDNLELLMALKPHPKSIALAQAAMESAWGQSRFFQEANNLFGVWSYNKDEPRIPASALRGEKTIWLKKYSTVKDAIKDYYKTLSRSWAFEEFRKLNYEKENQNPYLLVEKLQKYSEKGAIYTKQLSDMISYNGFTKFDEVSYERKKVIIKPKQELPLVLETKEQLLIPEPKEQFVIPEPKEQFVIPEIKEELPLVPEIKEPTVISEIKPIDTTEIEDTTNKEIN